MPKPAADKSMSAVLAAADEAERAAADRVAADLVDAVAEGVKDIAAAPPAAAPRKLFTAHSQAAAERLLTEERALAETLNELDAQILALTDKRDDAYRAYAAVQGARQALGGVN